MAESGGFGSGPGQPDGGGPGPASHGRATGSQPAAHADPAGGVGQDRHRQRALGHADLYVVSEVQAAIAAGHHPPGARLPGEQALASQYGVTVSAARRAVAMLRMTGQIVCAGTRGHFVAPPATSGGAAGQYQAVLEQLYSVPGEVRRVLRELRQVQLRLDRLEACCRTPGFAGPATGWLEPPLAYEGDPRAAPLGGTGLWVAILGPVEVMGPCGPLLGPHAELVLALALSGAPGLPIAALQRVLGPDPSHPKSSDAARQLIVRTRRKLGRAPGGRNWIEHPGGARGNYRLHEAAVLDWARFHALAERGRRAENRDDLAAALALVRGGPLTRSSRWWLETPLIEMIRAEIVDAAEMLSRLHLAVGDPAAAARAARAGLAADRSASSLRRALERAEEAAGSAAGFTAVADSGPGPRLQAHASRYREQEPAAVPVLGR